MTRETLTLGPTPASEACEQLGAHYDPANARAECRAFIGQLIRVFGEPPDGARLVVVSNPHDFGAYLEVGVRFDGDDQRAAEYAYRLESEAPGEWDEAARAELGLGRSWKDWAMDPDANLQEQERLYETHSVRTARMRELRDALWAWLRHGGFEPQWSKCPRASKHYREYGGSNTV